MIAPFLVLAICVTNAALGQTSAEPGDRGPKSRILRLLSQTHAKDKSVAKAAEEQLKQFGVTATQIEWGRKLTHPDVKVRVDLATSLIKTIEPRRTQFFQELAQDSNPQVRLAMLDAIENFLPASQLQQQVIKMAESDADTVVRGHARLLAARFKNKQTSVAKPEGKGPLSRNNTPDEISMSTKQKPVPAATAKRPPAGKTQPARTAATPKSMEPLRALPSKMSVPRRMKPLRPVSRASAQSRIPQPNLKLTPSTKQTSPESRLTQPEPATAKHLPTKSKLPKPAPPKNTSTLPLTEYGHDVSLAPQKLSLSEQESASGIQPKQIEIAGDQPDKGLKQAKPELLGSEDASGSVVESLPTSSDSQIKSIQPVVAVGESPSPMTSIEPEPPVLERLSDPPRPDGLPPGVEITAYNYDEYMPLLRLPVEPTFGFSGPSGQLPTERQTSSHFVPIEDRWRIGMPKWDRYEGSPVTPSGHPWVNDYPGVEGHWWDPYNQNVLKGDFPIIGQHTFLNFTGTIQTLFDFREVPVATTPFESTRNPFREEFFGNPKQFFFSQFYRLRFDLFHGNQIQFKPLDWQVRISPTISLNYLDVNELGVVRPDVRKGTTRAREDFALEEWFIEKKLADITPDYDFVSVRAGSQLFNSDFRGFIFFDTNRAVRLFGSNFSNRDQFNLIWFDQQEKNTNSGLNTYEDRHQNILIANYYRQDFIWPGYTSQVSFHYNLDKPSTRFDDNDFLVRPDPAGVFQEHEVEAYYLGWTGDGHIRRYNINHALYWVTGKDRLNPISGRELDINATMAALEVSYDRDWARFRASFFYASGDDNPVDGKGEGFDTIFDNPVFAGGEFSYWQRQQIRLFGVALVNDRSLVPDLRSSKIQGQSNFTNPGLFLVNAGFDMDITPKFRTIMNMNYLWFDHTESLEEFTFQSDIDRKIGLDLSLGMEYRPFHNDNVIILAGVSSLVPGEGFKDLYNEFQDDVDTLYAAFIEVFMTY